MNANSIVATLEKLGYLRDEQLKAELSTKSVRELIVDFVLPWVVEVGGQDTRGWRLSPSFMKLMTKHASDFIAADREFGEMLFELALQRIQCHPNLKSIDYRGMLPVEYKKYSAAYDQPGLWGDAEWEFMQTRLLDGLELSNMSYRTHCKNLIFEILSEVPHEAGFSSWFGVSTDVPSIKLYRWAVSRATWHTSPDGAVEYLLKVSKGDWRVHKSFYAQFASGLDWEQFFAQVDLEKEQYYRGISRFALKLFGRYNKATKKRIREEIRRAHWRTAE